MKAEHTAAATLRKRLLGDLKTLHLKYGVPLRRINRAAGWSEDSAMLSLLVRGRKSDMTLTQAEELELAIDRTKREKGLGIL